MLLGQVHFHMSVIVCVCVSLKSMPVLLVMFNPALLICLKKHEMLATFFSSPRWKVPPHCQAKLLNLWITASYTSIAIFGQDSFDHRTPLLAPISSRGSCWLVIPLAHATSLSSCCCAWSLEHLGTIENHRSPRNIKGLRRLLWGFGQG